MVTANWVVNRHTAGNWEQIQDTVIGEVPLNIHLDGSRVGTIFCIPSDLELLVVGYLFQARLIANDDDLEQLIVDPEKNEAHAKRRLRTPSSPEPPRLEKPQVSPPLVVHLAETLAQNHLFRLTGAVHCGLIARQETVIFSTADTGRFNVLDKITGFLLKERLSPTSLVLAFSGRLTHGVLQRVARAGIRAILSPAAPTSGGLAIAAAEGITTIGFARGERFNVYTDPERLLT